jgi:DNA modification methylase
MAQTPSILLNWHGKQAPRAVVPADLRLSRRGSTESVLIQGDNLSAMAAHLEQHGARYALAYLDPPFFTGRAHSRVERSRDPRSGRVIRKEVHAFDDRWDSLEHYLSALYDRVSAARALLAPHGCLVLHVDPKTSHYAKVLCDEIFGSDCFASEIIWRYRRWPAKTRNFQRVHDVLLRYVRDPGIPPRFSQLYEPLAPSTLATWGDRKQRAVVDAEGRRRRSSSTPEATPGTPLGDVWEIGIVAPVAKERTGYPTQKPLALLERLLLSCSEPGDWVLDPYAGSGTTLLACRQLERKAVGIDLNADALAIARKRLKEAGVSPREEIVSPLRSTRPADGRRRVA